MPEQENNEAVKALENGNNGGSGWQQWGKHVLLELSSINKRIEKVEEKLVTLNIELVKLQIKAGLWGMMAGSIPVLVWLALYFISKKP